MSKKANPTTYVEDTGILKTAATDCAGRSVDDVFRSITPEQFEAVRREAATDQPPLTIEQAANWAQDVWAQKSRDFHLEDSGACASAGQLDHSCLRVAELIEAGAPGGRVAGAAYIAGLRAWELAIRLWHEAHARRGKSTVADLRSGRRTQSRRRRNRDEDIRRLWERMRQTYPDRTVGWLDDQVGKELQVGASTVYRARRNDALKK